MLDHPVLFASRILVCSERRKGEPGIDLMPYKVTSRASTNDDTDNELAVNSNVAEQD